MSFFSLRHVHPTFCPLSTFFSVKFIFDIYGQNTHDIEMMVIISLGYFTKFTESITLTDNSRSSREEHSHSLLFSSVLLSPLL